MDKKKGKMFAESNIKRIFAAKFTKQQQQMSNHVSAYWWWRNSRLKKS
ncbi:hypothetical protein HMPREF9136_2252 [Prevotella dentalis DSM 3688]|uniref:Uncharacterized protein n=1 Tax=Prevotella dentalis (strain ATCC 49559 / DSM 3688 / JCM 13448 / NCTC 12043 / ES 2772) TaxID=908937 RepID=F9D5X4_PREDD|nr:hypothetical protein HMPREF9136_2252 [Prevotella dentalis DSM 3688]